MDVWSADEQVRSSSAAAAAAIKRLVDAGALGRVLRSQDWS